MTIWIILQTFSVIIRNIPNDIYNLFSCISFLKLYWFSIKIFITNLEIKYWTELNFISYFLKIYSIDF